MMNNIERIFSESGNAEQFARGYIAYLSTLLSRLDVAAIAAVAYELEDARENHNTIFIVGNGGSAATATTMANDIGFDIIKKTATDKPFRAFALTDNTSVMTAISNDAGYENVFLNQLKIHYRPGDKLLAISASGNSTNVITAAEWVKQQGGRVIGFLGFEGGSLMGICDVAVHVRTLAGEYGPV